MNDQRGTPSKGEEEGPTEFSPEEIARHPFLKEIFNKSDLWRSHGAAVTAEKGLWEKLVRDMFTHKVKADGLFPLLAIIG